MWQSSGLPPLPANPLPRLQTLIRAEPALQLRWHLLDLLYAYCLVMRLYNGDPSADLQVRSAQGMYCRIYAVSSYMLVCISICFVFYLQASQCNTKACI